ncbi:hypothetical protein [Kordiimonas pumila]|uniref:Uncharacterized protein n=1 Tax=Kordiimonas pumila TaxID=2161677 RepID=A0ABV7D440_9PROT|nr:hypothetical protein [Kordiimonas pumila]
MKKNDTRATENVVPFKARDDRFPKAALDYIDTLLTVQRDRFDAEMACLTPTDFSDLPTRPTASLMVADTDKFIGAGWSSLGQRRDGTSFRWMGRVGTLMLPLNLEAELPFSIFGCGFTKRRFLKETTLWLDDMPVRFSLTRRGFNRWYMTGTLPKMAPRPYYILRLEAPALARLAEGVDAFFSLAVSEVRVNC